MADERQQVKSHLFCFGRVWVGKDCIAMGEIAVP